MKKNVARILPFSKGEYDPTYNYDVLDQVQSGVSVYQSKKPNNLGHPVTDTAWWQKYFDAAAAIEAATSNESPEVNNGAVVARLMAIDTNGQACSITPAKIVEYVLDALLDSDVLAIPKNVGE
jgi:hypothetical protein